MACTHSDEEDSATSSSHWEAQVDLCSALRDTKQHQLLDMRKWLQQPAGAHHTAAASCWEQDSPRVRCDPGHWADASEGVQAVPSSRAQPKRRPSLLVLPNGHCAAASSPSGGAQLVPNMSTLQFHKRRKCYASIEPKAHDVGRESAVVSDSEPLLVPSAPLTSLCGLRTNTRIALTPNPVPDALHPATRRPPLMRPPPLLLPETPAAPGADTPHSNVRRCLAVDVPFGGDTPLPGGALSTVAMRANLERWMDAMEEGSARRKGQALPPSALLRRTPDSDGDLPPPAFVLLSMAGARSD